MSYLPAGFEKLQLASRKNYWKLSQMQDGENRFRIVSRPIAGWIDWKDKRPLRFRPENKPKASVDPAIPMKAFWALYVWDYTREDLFILEITQANVIKQLMTFASDDDWGDFTKYDLKLKKEGTGIETKYYITPMPHKPLPPKAAEALKSRPVRLEALYESGDPWTDLEAPEPLPSFLEMDEPVDTALLVANIVDLIEELKNGPTILANFCQTYALTDWRKASEAKLRELEGKLKTNIQTQGGSRGAA